MLPSLPKMPILFIAVQCVQCMTMQVKQQKKSSNKWVCAVCNQRQSVLRIHARGHLARDIRNFVQEFNLSRRESLGGDSFSPKTDCYFIASEIDSAAPLVVESACSSKRRTEWSEYLIPEEDDLFAKVGEDIDQEIPTNELNYLSKKRLTMTEKKMPLQNFSRSHDVDYKGNLQKRKEECIAIDREEERDQSLVEDSIDQLSFADCSRVVDEEVHPDFM